MDIRLGLIGFGGIGMEHAKRVLSGDVPGMRLTACANRSPERMNGLDGMGGRDVARFTDYREMLSSGLADACLIATPHPAHFEQGMAAFELGLDVLMEKPACLTAGQARALMNTAKKNGRVYAMMFNKRENPAFKTMKKMLSSGEYGGIRRVNCVSTGWFRPQCYYDYCGWRGTWVGEGGGALVTQASHTIDLLLWLLGFPQSVNAFCHEGKWHDIEVEDEVTAYMEWEAGFSGVFITSTGEAPGTERIEIVTDKATITYENGELRLCALQTPLSVFTAEYKNGYGAPESHEEIITPPEPEAPGHTMILRNFVDAVNGLAKPVADGKDGLNQALLTNAMHLSSWQGRRVKFPMDEKLYESMLKEKIAASRPKPDTGNVMNTKSAY